MKNRIRLIGMFLIVSFVILTACGAQAAKPTGTVPSDLQTIEAAAEDIIDFAPSGGWDKIGADVTNIATAWNAYQPQAGQAGASQDMQGAMTSALTQLQAAATSKDPAATMQASNNVSAAVVEMYALYNPKVPADIGRLDVLERQVILDVARQDYSAAEGSLSKAKSAWERVKASALEHKGKDTAAQFEASLAAQASALTAKDNSTLTDEARNALEIVDSLEQLY
ncbi:MAG TPA: hypothetical protein VK206_09710 [Anaerolineales bacterium]|nr:hypothetical protein [Anaerolineales bacterium]HLO34192.1 hypothetical protein [Anaerolineales bacterium]